MMVRIVKKLPCPLLLLEQIPWELVKEVLFLISSTDLMIRQRPLCQVSQLLERKEVRLEPKRGSRVPL